MDVPNESTEQDDSMYDRNQQFDPENESLVRENQVDISALPNIDYQVCSMPYAWKASINSSRISTSTYML